MATEELKLIFKVDKAGQVSVDQIGKKMRKFDSATRQSNKSLGSMSKLLKGSIVVTGLNQALGLVRQIGGAFRMVGEQIEEGIGANRAFKAFDQLAFYAGKTADQMHEDLRAATLMEVDDTTLEQWSNQLTKITKDAGTSAALIGFAFSRGLVEGIDPKKYVRKLTNALASGDVITAATLGIYADKTKILKDAAEAAGKSVETLTEKQKDAAVVAALVAAAQEELAGMAKMTGHGFLQATTELDNFVSTMQQTLAGGVPEGIDRELFGDIFNQGDLASQADAFIAAQDRVNAKIEESQALYEKYKKTAGSGSTMFAEPTFDARAATGAVAKRKMDEALAAAKKYSTENLTVLNKIKRSYFDAGEAATGFQEKLAGIGWENLVLRPADFDRNTELLKTQRDELLRLADSMGGLAEKYPHLSRVVDVLTDSAKASTEELKKATQAKKALTDASVANIKILEEELRGLDLYTDAGRDRAEIVRMQLAIMKEARTEGIKWANHMSTAGVTAGQAWAESLDLDAESLVDVATELNGVEEAKTILDEALKNGSPAEAQAAFDALGIETEELKQALIDAEIPAKLLDDIMTGLGIRTAKYGTATRIATTGTKRWAEALDQLRVAGGFLAGMAGELWGKVTEAPPPPKPKSYSGGARDITREELALRLSATRDGLTELEQLEAEHAVRVYGIQNNASNKRRAKEALMAEDAKVYADNVIDLEERKAARTQAAIDKVAKKEQERRDAIEAKVQGGVNEYYEGIDRVTDALRDQAIALGEITRLEAERAQIGRQLQDETLSESGRKVLLIQQETNERRLANDALREQAEAVRGVGRAMSDAAAMSSQWASAFGEDDPLSERAKLMVANLNQVSVAIGGLVGSMGGSAEEMAAAGGAAVSALGGVAAGMMDGVGEAAVLMMAFELATAATMAGFLQFPQAAQHGVAAVMYGVVAAMAGKGSSSKAPKKSVAKSLGTSAPASTSAEGNTYNLFFGGERLHTDEQIADRLVDVLNTGSFSGKRVNARMVGGF